MENSLHIDKTTFGKVEVNACAKELLCKHGNVEMVRVKTGKVASTELLVQRRCQFLKSGLVLYVIVTNSRKRHHFCRNRLLWIHKQVGALLSTIRIYLDIRDLNDTVINKVKPRCLEVEDNQGLCKIQFHDVSLSDYSIMFIELLTELVVQQHRHDEHQQSETDP